MTLALGVLTAVNIALACFGVSMAIMSPMMFDRGGQDETLLWGVFWSIWAFPALAVVCVVLPWLLLWLRLPYRAGDVRHSERLPRHLGRDPLHLLLAAGANGPQHPSGLAALDNRHAGLALMMNARISAAHRIRESQAEPESRFGTGIRPDGLPRTARSPRGTPARGLRPCR